MSTIFLGESCQPFTDVNKCFAHVRPDFSPPRKTSNRGMTACSVKGALSCRRLTLVETLLRGLSVQYLAVLMLTLKVLSELYLRNHKKLILGRDIGWGCMCATLWCDLNLTLL